MQDLRFGIVTMLALRMAFCAGLCAGLLGGPASAQTPGGGPHLRLELVAETSRPRPGGAVALAFVATPDPGWHGYWQNPGDAGVATRLGWMLPPGVTAGPLRYPVPQRLQVAGLMNYVYEGPYAELVTLQLPAVATGTALPVRVRVDYLVCTDAICVPETQTLSTRLTAGDGTPDPARAADFARWRAALPQPLAGSARFEVTREGRFRLAVPVPATLATDAYFFPLASGAIDYAAPQTLGRAGDALVIETRAVGHPASVEGVLALGNGQALAVRAVPGAVPPARPPTPPWRTALLAFLGAVLGGLVLNVMPCVFPILSLKALSLARAGGDTARGEALAYTAGVVLVCLALGAVLLGLRAAGSTAGWAFQLQDPRVILLLLLLVTGIALNLSGLFELPAPRFVNRAAAGGHGGAFATGALAAFVATPCTGPFMGAALGAALVLPWGAALAVFAGLGLGLALPFLLLGFVPALRRRLPKPGAWMETLRHLLAVPMWLTALALAWVLGRQAGVDGMALGLAAALSLGLGLWWAGRRQARGRGHAWLPALPLFALALLAVPLAHPAAAPTVASAGAEPFSEARLQALRRARRPVFVYFTADWCLTCKVNERAVIETDAVRRALADGRVAVLAGDWTDGDATLGRFIQAHNRAGVPLYLWYAPGAAEPRVLPQILTRGLLEELADGR